MKDAGLI